MKSDIVRAFFDSLNTFKANYCVMNSYERLPDEIPTDIDIAIDETSFHKLDTFLLNFSMEHGIFVVQKIWHGYKKCAYILSPLLLDATFRLQLDFFVDFSARKYPNLMPNEMMLRNRIPYKSFFVPSPEIEVPFILMRRIIKNDIKQEHLSKLKELITTCPGAMEAIKELLGEKAATLLTRMIEEGDEAYLKTYLNLHRKALKTLSSKNATIFYRSRYLVAQWKRMMERLLHPIGVSVIFLGPDGSGKSTVASLVLERVAGSFHGSSAKYWRPRLLPAMGRLKIWNPSAETKENPKPHSIFVQNPVKSFLRFLYYLADYVFGYPVHVYWAKVRKQIVVFDRYYYDFLVDLRRYQFNIPVWLPRLFLPLIPRADLTIYLDAEPQDLMKRKQELTMQELQRQVAKYRSILPIIPNSVRIETNRAIEPMVKEISRLILTMKAEQTKAILRDEN